MIETLLASERPRERCLSQGASCLSLRECLAVILGTGPSGLGCLGVADAIVRRPGKDLPEPDMERAFFIAMESLGTAHLEEIAGLGNAGKARLLAAFELGRRYARYRERARKENDQRPAQRLGLPERACDRVPWELRTDAHEWLGFVPVYQNRTLGQLCVFERGLRTHVNTDPVQLFARLLALRPFGFYLFHNHPSGDLTSSEADRDLTRRIEQLASFFGIKLLGHAIVCARENRWIVL